MAKKKQEIQLMREIESQEEWEDVMGREGLWVVDVYQEWSGHCDAMVSNFRRIKNELGDDFLHFAMAKSDTIESLDKYRGSCEPCFLFFAGGVLVSYVHGANSPQILRTLTEQLSQEHKVMEGNTERKEVKDPFVANRESADDAQRDDDDDDEDAGRVRHGKVSAYPQDFEEGRKFQYNGELVMYGDDLTPAKRFEEVEEGYTVAIIKPNAVAEGKVDDILAEMQAHGIDVIAQEERQLTEEEAREFYVHLKDEDYFEDLVSFMASGPSHMLVLTKGQEDDSIIKDWRDMLGPPTVEDAKEKAPESLRAKYGQAGQMNALHGSDSKETAAREMAFFFPHMQIPTIQKKKKTVERTLALIRPDAFASNRDAILERIKEAGFQIALQKEVTLTKEQAEEFYKEHAGQHYYEELTARMSSGPLLALGLAREDAVQNWRGMLGPTNVEEAKAEAPDSLRAQFAVDDAPVNQLHGSDDPETAQKEIQFFFPIEQTVAMIKPDAIGTKDAIIDKIHQAGFRIAARKETVITREIAESIYEDQKDKEYFNDLVEHMISGPTVFMVLSGEGAVEGWRQEIGPTDPAQAKETAPDSLRAQFGTDLLNNAVHGCSSAEEAQRKIHMMFGDLEFNPDGTVKGEVAHEPEEQAVSGSPVPQAADVAPEYRQQAEQEQQAEQQQQQAEQQQQEAAAEQPQAEQPAEGKAEEQEAQQAEQPAGAEGQTEEAGQSEEKPAEGGEAAEKTEGQVEEKPSETAADSAEKTQRPSTAEKDQRPSTAEKDQSPSTAEKDESAGAAEKDEKAGTAEKDESAEKTEGEVEEKPTESSAGKEADKEAAGQAAQQKASEEQDTTQQDTTQQDTTQQDTTQQDTTQQDTTQQDTTQQDTTQQDTTQQDTTQQDTTQQDSTPSQDKKPEEATTQQAEGAKAEEPAAAEQPAQEAKTEESPKDNTPAAEESKDTKAEEQKDQTEGQKEEESKGEQKEGTAEAKKEGTAEAKKEGDEEKKEA